MKNDAKHFSWELESNCIFWNQMVSLAPWILVTQFSFCYTQAIEAIEEVSPIRSTESEIAASRIPRLKTVLPSTMSEWWESNMNFL